jgi:preprotein translocase subunit YajC
VGQLIFLAAIFALAWALLIRPQSKKRQEQVRLLASIEPGDEVLTVGGLYGIVREIDEEDDLIVEVADGIRVRIARRAVGGVVKPDEDDDEDDGEDDVDAADESDVADAELDEDQVANGDEAVSDQRPA